MYWRHLCAEAQLCMSLILSLIFVAPLWAQNAVATPCLSVSSDAIAEVSVRRFGRRAKRSSRERNHFRPISSTSPTTQANPSGGLQQTEAGWRESAEPPTSVLTE